MNNESIMKVQALEKKKQKLYEELVDLELNNRSKDNILKIRDKSVDIINGKINAVNAMILETASRKIEKVQRSSSIEK